MVDWTAGESCEAAVRVLCPLMCFDLEFGNTFWKIANMTINIGINFFDREIRKM